MRSLDETSLTFCYEGYHTTFPQMMYGISLQFEWTMIDRRDHHGLTIKTSRCATSFVPWAMAPLWQQGRKRERPSDRRHGGQRSKLGGNQRCAGVHLLETPLQLTKQHRAYQSWLSDWLLRVFLAACKQRKLDFESLEEWDGPPFCLLGLPPKKNSRPFGFSFSFHVVLMVFLFV